jgi:phage tail-like protein
VCFAGDDFLRRFTGIFQELAEGLRQRIDGVEHIVDVTVAPPAFVRWVGGWLGLRSIDPSLPVERQRELVLGFGGLLARRGTRAGLQRAVELATGRPAVVHDPGAIVREGDPLPPPGPVVVELPDRSPEPEVSGTPGISQDDIVAVIEDWLPAAAGAELWVGGQRVWAGHQRRPR